MVEKSIDEINERIRDGSVCVVTADRMSEIVDAVAAREGLLLICGDHQAHLRDRSRGVGVRGVGKVPLIVTAPPRVIVSGSQKNRLVKTYKPLI